MIRMAYVGSENDCSTFQIAIEKLNKTYHVDIQIEYYNSILLLDNNQEIYDLVLIDIDDKYIETKGSLMRIGHYFKNSLFVSEFSQCPINYLCFKPIGYIGKPIHIEQIVRKLEIWLDSILVLSNVFEFKVNRERFIVLNNQIMYFQSEKNKVFVHTRFGKYCFYGKLSDLATQKGLQRFMYVHKSYLVNPDYIELLTSSYLLINGDYIPISRSRMSDVNKWRLNRI